VQAQQAAVAPHRGVVVVPHVGFLQSRFGVVVLALPQQRNPGAQPDAARLPGGGAC